MLVISIENLYNYSMTSPEFDPSPDDPSPRIASLVDSFLEAPHVKYSELELSPSTFDPLHSHNGSALLHKLLPELSVDSIYSLRDAISRQGEVADEPVIQVPEPTRLFERWIKRFKRSKDQDMASSEPEEQADTIAISDTIAGQAKQLHILNPTSERLIVVRKSSLSGSFTLNDQPYHFDPATNIFEVGVARYDSHAENQPMLRNGRKYYSFVPTYGDMYKTKEFGGSVYESKLSDTDRRNKALHSALRLLESLEDANTLQSW